VVAEVDEDEPAVVAARVGPAGDGDAAATLVAFINPGRIPGRPTL